MPENTNIVKLMGCKPLDRFLAFVFDNFLALIVAFIVAVRLAAYGDVVSWTAFGLSYFAYYCLSEMAFGNTVGKWFCGLRIRTLAGKKCNWWQLSIRAALRLFEVNPLLLGGLPAGIAICVTPQRQRIGDVLAGTVVVRRTDLR